MVVRLVDEDTVSAASAPTVTVIVVVPLLLPNWAFANGVARARAITTRNHVLFINIILWTRS
jgi:hypothetical protein